MEIVDANKKKIMNARIDPSMDKYKDVVLFPGKLAKAKKDIQNSNLIEFLKKLDEHPSEENK